MDLIAISENRMVNVDLIESIEINTIKGNKVFTLVIGGKSYTPDLAGADLLELLLKRGTIKSTNQFFSV